jgi:hypothetical protein
MFFSLTKTNTTPGSCRKYKVCLKVKGREGKGKLLAGGSHSNFHKPITYFYEKENYAHLLAASVPVLFTGLRTRNFAPKRPMKPELFCSPPNHTI